MNKNKETLLLLVEDGKANQVVIMSMLENAGYKVELAEDGLQAIESVKRKFYDLILMDISMPYMDGIEAASLIRGMAGEIAKIPIIAITAYTTVIDRQRCFESGMNDYLTKPINKKTLIKTVKKWLADKELQDEKKNNLTANTDLEFIDEKVVKQLEQDLSETLIAEILSVFKKETEDLLEQLEMLKGNQDVQGMQAIFHTLKSSFGTFGAINLSQLAKLAEDFCRDADSQKVIEIIDIFIKKAKRVLETLAERYK